MGFGEVGRRPLRGMVRVRVVEADDVQSQAACLPLDLHQLLRGDVVAVVRGVGAGIAGADDLLNLIYGRGDRSVLQECSCRAGRRSTRCG